MNKKLTIKELIDSTALSIRSNYALHSIERELYVFLDRAALTPDWDNVSPHAVKYVVTTNYLNTNGDTIADLSTTLVENRPIPQVGVGQCWLESGPYVNDITDSVHVIFVSEKSIAYTNYHGREHLISKEKFLTDFSFVPPIE